MLIIQPTGEGEGLEARVGIVDYIPELVVVDALEMLLHAEKFMAAHPLDATAPGPSHWEGIDWFFRSG